MKTSKFFLTTLFAAAAMTASVYAGEYEITGAVNANTTVDAGGTNKKLNELTSSDTIVFNAASGYLVGWNNGSLAVNIRLAEDSGDTPAFNWGDGSSSAENTMTFEGSLSGTGTFRKKTSASNKKQSFLFAGNVSGFSGNFLNTESGVTSKLSFGNGGAAKATNNISGTGSIEWLAQPVIYNYASGDLNVGNSKISTANLEFKGGANYTISAELDGYNATATGNTLTIAAGTTTFAGTVSGFGTINVASGATADFADSAVFDLDGLTATDGVYTIISGDGTIADSWKSLTKDNFALDGRAIGRGTINVSALGKVEITSGAMTLTWTGGNGTWDFTSKNWVDENGATEVFCSGDSVVFDTADAEITLDGSVNVAAMTVSAATTLSGADVVLTVAPDALSIAENASLTINEGVTIDFGTNPDSNSGVKVNHSGLLGTGTVKVQNTLGHGTSVHLGNFNGLVDFTGNFNWASKFYTLGKDATLKLTSHNNSTLWSGESDGNIIQDVIFASNYEISLSDYSLTIAGTVDAKDMELRATGTHTLTFSGDTTIGTFKHRGSSVTLNFSGGKSVLGNYSGISGTGASATVNVGANSDLTVSEEFILVTENSGTKGTLNLSGKMSVDGTFWVARDGVGVVNIENGGTLLTNTLKFGTNQDNWSDTNPANKSSTVNLKTGGTLVIGAGGLVTQGAMNAETLNFNGGTFGTSAGNLAVNLSGLKLELGAGTSVINTGKYSGGSFSATDASKITISNVISGKGSLKLVGPGSLTLSAANTYAGGTIVSGGTLTASSATSLGSGAVTVDGGKLVANSGMGVSRLSVLAGSVETKGTVATDSVTVSGGSAKIGGALTTGAISVSGGALDIATLVAVGDKLNLTVSGGTLALKGAPSAEYTVDLRGGEISGLNLSSAKEGSVVRLRSGTLSSANLEVGTVIVYSELVDEAERNGIYLNNEVDMTINGSLTLSASATKLDLSNLIFGKAGESYALFNVGEGADGNAIATAFNQVSGLGTFSFDADNKYVVFSAGEGMDFALIWDTQAGNDYWSGTSFQGTEMNNLANRTVNFGKILPAGTNTEVVNILAGAEASTLLVAASEENTYRLNAGEEGASLTLASLRITRGTLDVETAMTVGNVEVSNGTLIAGVKDALTLDSGNPVEVNKGVLSLRHKDATNASAITLSGGSTLEFVSGALDSVASKGIKVSSSSENAHAVLHWLDGALDDVAGKVVFDNASHVEFKIDSGTVEWSADAYVRNSGNFYYKTGVGTLSLARDESLGGTFYISEGALSLGHAESKGRIFSGNIIASGENAALLLSRANSFGTEESFDPVEVELRDGAQMLLARDANDDRQTLVNVSLILGEDTLVRSQSPEEPNLRGIILGAGSRVVANGNAEIATIVQLSRTDGSEFNVGQGATLTLSGAVVDSLENPGSKLKKDGAGTLVLSGALSGTAANSFNIYTGETEIADGTLRFEGAGIPGSGNVTVGENATLEVDTAGKVVFAGTISGSGAFRALGGSVELQSDVTGVSGFVGEDASVVLADSATFNGNMELRGELGGNGTFKGDITLGENAKLYAANQDVFNFEAGTISGVHAFTKTGAGAVVVGTTLNSDFDIGIENGTLQTSLEQTVDTITLSGGILGTNDTGAGSWVASKLNVEAGTAGIQSVLSLKAPMGQNNLHLDGNLYVGGILGDNTYGALEVEGTLNLTMGVTGSLNIGSLDGADVRAGGRLYANVLNVDASVRTITLGTVPDGDVLSELAFGNANFRGDIEIKGTSGAVSASGTAHFEGAGTSTIEGNLVGNGSNAVVDIARLGARVGVEGEFSGALSKTGRGNLDIAAVGLDKVTALSVSEGQLAIEELLELDPDAQVTLEQVQVTDGAILAVRDGTLSLAENGSFKLTGGSRYVGDLLINEKTSLTLDASEIKGTLGLVGDAFVNGATVETVIFGNMTLDDAGEPLPVAMSGILSVAGGAPAINADNLVIVEALKLANININYGTLGSEFAVVEYGESLSLFGDDFDAVGDSASFVLDSMQIDGRDIYLMLERDIDDLGNESGELKIVAYGTLLWNGAKTWDVGKDNGWLQTSVNGNSQAFFSNDKYVGFNFSAGDSITVAEDVNVSGAVFNGTGKFTLNFEDGIIKDKSDGTAAAVSVQSGTVVFNDQGIASADGVFSGGLNIAKGAGVETNSDKLIGSGAISLYGTLSFVGGSAEYSLADVTVAGADAVLNVAVASSSLSLEKVTGTVLTKTGAGSLVLAGEAALDKFVVAGGNAVIRGSGETAINAIVVDEGAGVLTFESDASLGALTKLNIAASKRVEFVSNASKLNSLVLDNASELAFRTDGTFTLGGTAVDANGDTLTVNASITKTGNNLAAIVGNLALQGAAKSADGKFSTGAMFDVTGTLKIDGSVNDVADSNAGNFLWEKAGAGVLNITGDVNSKATLLISAGSIVIDGGVNLTGNVEVGGDVSLTVREGGWIGMRNSSLVVAEGKKLTLNAPEALSVLSDLTVAGTLAVNGELSFAGNKNVYKALEIAANSSVTLSSEVASFEGETVKLGANAEIVVDDTQLSASSGVLTVDAAGTSVAFENDGKITFSSVYVTGEQTMEVLGDGEMTVLGEIETKLTLDIEEDAAVTINNAKLAQVGKFLGEGTLRKYGKGDLYILQKTASNFTGNFVAKEGTTYFYGDGALGQAEMIADAEVVFARTAVFGNSGDNVVANSLVGGNGTLAVIGEGNSLKFTNAIGAGFSGTLEARDGGKLVYNQVVAKDNRNVSLKNAGVLEVSALNSVGNETATSLGLGVLSVSGKGNEVALAEGRELSVGTISVADAKGAGALTFSGSGTASIAGAVTKDSASKATLDIYTDEDFTGVLTLSGADSAHRNTYVNSGTVVFENATAGGTGTIFLTNAEKSLVRFDVGVGNVVSTAVSGTGTIEGTSGAIDDISAFTGTLVAVDGGTFTLEKGNATELASKAVALGAETGATLVVTTDGSVSELDMGAASFVGDGTVRLDLNTAQTLSVYTGNTIDGTLEIAGGVVKVLEEGNLGTAAVRINAGASLNLASDVLLNREISGDGTLVKNTSGTGFIAGTINAKALVATGALSIAQTGSNASFEIKNGTLELSETYQNGRVVSRSAGTQTFDAEYIADGVARFSHNARNSNSVVAGSFAWKNDVAGSLIFAGGGTGSEFLPEIKTGSVVKTGAGKWYLDAFSSAASIKVENGGGTLAIGGYVGNENQEIYIGRDGVLEIAEFAGNADSVIRGKLSGTGILAVSVTTSEVSFALTGSSDWVLRVDPNVTAKYGEGLSATNILLASAGNTQDLGGTLNVDAVAGTTLGFDGKVLTIQGSSKDFLDVRNAKAVKTGAGTWDLSNATVKLDGLLQIKEGTVKVASFKSNPTSGIVEVQGNGLLEVGVDGKTGSLASLAGAGRVNFVAGTTLVENVNGAQSPEDFNSDFSGAVRIDANANVVVKSYASFGNASQINLLGALESSQAAESALNKLTGDGTLRINNATSSVRTIYASDNTFTGTIDIVRGRLVMNTDVFAALSNEVVISSDVASGLVLRNESGNAVSLSDFTGKNVGNTGAFFLESAEGDNGFVLQNEKSFGYASRLQLNAGATMLFGKGANVKSDLYVAENATLVLGNANSTSLSFRSTKAVATRTVEGDLTIAGNLITALPAEGSVAVHATGSATVEKTAIVEVDGRITEGDEVALISSDVKAIENGALFRTASGERLSARVAEDATVIMVGQATPVEDLIPSGMDKVAETIFSDTDSDIYKAIYWSGTDAEQRAKLTNFSPVSFAGALDLSTGLTQLENDLLRQRLEQRRYDRAYPEAEGTIKAFANVIGNSTDSDEGENKAANYDMSHTGAVAGFDTLVNYDFLIGASFTYDFGKAKVHNGGGKHETDTARVNLYGMSMLDEVSYFGFGVGFGVLGVDTKRTNSLETLKGDASGTDFSVSTTLGRMFVLSEENGVHVSPYIGLDYTYSRIGSFSETGGKESALDVDDLERSSLRGTIGATLNWLPTADWRFTLEAAFRHEFLDSDSDIDAKFIGGAYAGMDASATAYFGGEDVISVGPRVEYRINSEWSVSAGYTFETDLDNATTHSANLGVRCRF